MIFSPAYLSALIVKPLRFFFENNAPADLVWSDDPKISGIEIDTINNFNKIPVQAKPRILVSRGQYNVTPTGLSDNLAQARGGGLNKFPGSPKDVKMVLIRGDAQILIEARNEGTCEKVVDLAQHFLAWTSPMISNVNGFKNFAFPMTVSTCTPGKDDTEIFTCTINIPWTREEQWIVESDDVMMKDFLVTIVSE